MRLFWLALSTFAIGTEAFVIAGLLPVIASDLHITLVATGQLVTAYALTYAIGSPILAVLFNNLDRKRALILAMGCFIVGNIAARIASSPHVGVEGLQYRIGSERLLEPLAHLGVPLTQGVDHGEASPITEACVGLVRQRDGGRVLARIERAFRAVFGLAAKGGRQRRRSLSLEGVSGAVEDRCVERDIVCATPWNYRDLGDCRTGRSSERRKGGSDICSVRLKSARLHDGLTPQSSPGVPSAHPVR